MKKQVFTFILLLFIPVTAIFSQDDLKLSYITAKQQAASRDEFKNGYFYYNNMAYEAAISFFRSTLAIDPKNELAQYWLGRAYVMAGYNDLAISTWESLQRSMGHSDLFLQQELDKIYTKGFKYSLKEDATQENFVFLRMINTLSNPSYIAIDNNNNFYVSDFYKGRINIYDANLKKIFILQDGLSKPINIFFKKNLMYVSDFGTNSIRVYDIENSYKFLYEFGGFGIGEGSMAGPVGIDYYKDKLYIVDQGNNRIQIFQESPKPYFVGQFGHRGSGPGEFLLPSGIAVYKDKIWVADKMNKRTQIFDLQGNYITQIKQDDIQNPIQLFVFQSHLYLIDQNMGFFVLDDDTNEFNLLQKPSQGLQRISSAWMDKNGILFMSDVRSPTVIAYAKDAEKLSSLDISTMFVTTSAYPKVVMKLRIRDSEARDIKGLDSQSIKVTQDGYKIGATLKPLIPLNDRLSTTIIIRNTPDMAQNKDKIVKYIDKIIDSKRPEDRIRLITYNNKSKIEQNFTENTLDLKNSLNTIDWSADKVLVSDDIFDRVLYDTLDSNEFNDSHAAVLVIDNNSDTTFEKYSEEVIANHSERIGVPTYVVNFDNDVNASKNKSLEFIANKSGGVLLLFNKSNKIFDILDTMRERSPLFYTLSYTNPTNTGYLSGYWANVVLRLEYRSLYGVDQVGYLVNL